MNTAFFAMVHRMRYINRWGLMRNTEPENIQEHSLEVAMLAHGLALTRRELFGEGRVCPEPGEVVLYALYHDVPEIITGDLASPIKYFNEDMRQIYQSIEVEAAKHLLDQLPTFMRSSYEQLLIPDRRNKNVCAILELVKAADRLSAYIKCIDELNAGNREFQAAERSIAERIYAMKLPEADWFMEHVLPVYRKPVDELDD